MEPVACSTEVGLWFKFLSPRPVLTVQFKDNNVIKDDHPSPGVAFVGVSGRFWYSSLTDMFQLYIFTFDPREEDPTNTPSQKESDTHTAHLEATQNT